ncbi:heme-binding protein [Tropicimonas sp. IMCC34043]|uniref:SOUL family heme-binding protein n=1 Tax=Tropicimonas sp. IMCC34043 TaxID=2248760 RepID=UPI000E26CDA9|nr:heme-binding protein [Tropicimonas sp. IMCC34043]
MPPRAARTIVAFAGLLTVAACSVFGGQAAPEPKYTVVIAEDPFEVRDYGEMVVVKTTIADGSNPAFRRLFDYISGQNEGSRKIAMTAPVLTGDAAEGTKIAMTAPVLQSREGPREMIFILTDAFTAETAPVPTNPKVSLGAIPARRVAVVRYSGSMNGKAAFAEARLREWMGIKGLQPRGPAEVAGYNPPWTVPAYRRNEVMIPVATEK